MDVLSDMAGKKGVTNAQISLAWRLHKYPHIVPIPGSKNQERILENLGAWNVELTDAEFAEEDWYSLVEYASRKDIRFTFKNGMEIKA